MGISKEAMLFGYLLGDGWVSVTPTLNYDKQRDKHYSTTRKQCGFSGDLESLEKIKIDLIELYGDIGKATIFTANTNSPKYHINGVTNKFSCSTRIVDIFIGLGAPVGNRVENVFLLPDWIVNGSIGVKRGFISGLYAAEGSIPSMQTNDKTARSFSLCLTKRVEHKDNLVALMNQISSICSDLGLSTKIKLTKTYTVAENVKATLLFSNNHDQVIRFCEQLSFRYCLRKDEERSHILQYYYAKSKMLNVLSLAYDEAMMEGSSPSCVAKKYGITLRQVMKWRERRTGYRIPNTFETYTNFKAMLSTINSVNSVEA